MKSASIRIIPRKGSELGERLRKALEERERVVLFGMPWFVKESSETRNQISFVLVSSGEPSLSEWSQIESLEGNVSHPTMDIPNT